MPKLILIKHASPVKDPAKPSRTWRLSDTGRDDAKRLADKLRSSGLSFQVVVTSDEPKARETGEIVGSAFGVPVEQGEDLHEHDRDNVPVMPTREFISSMALFFRESGRLVLGRETAADAHARFEAAVQEVMSKHAGQDVAIVTHGTVMSLYLAELLKREPFELWRALGLPSYVALDWEMRQPIEVVAKV